MALFKNYAEVTAADKRFTEVINAIRKSVVDYFPTYSTELPGVTTNEVSDFLCQFGDLYVDANDDLQLVYPVSKRMAESLTRWLANYDFVFVKAGKCVASRSNHPEAAKLLNQLLDIAR